MDSPPRIAILVGLAGLLAAGALRPTLEARPGPQAQQPAAVPSPKIAPHRALLDNYCYLCHDNAGKEAGLC